MPVSTNILKLESIDTVLDKNMTGKSFIEITAGIGENNLKKIDDFAEKTNLAITDIMESPSVIYVRGEKESDGVYTADASAIKKLIRNGIYIVSLDEENNVGSVSIRINGIVTVELNKLDMISNTYIPLEIGDMPKNTECIFRYNAVSFVMISNNALTLEGKDITDIVLKKEVIDDVVSENTDLPLSALQGKLLDEKIDDLNTALDTKIDTTKTELQENIDLKAPIESPTFTGIVSGVTGEMVGLGELTNDIQVRRDEMGVANGVATLDDAGLVFSSQLPSYVDDVLEFDSFDLFPTVGENGKIYVDTTTNLTYRWSGTQYIEISKSLALGETSTTAYPGDKGKKNADDIVSLKTDLASEIVDRTQGDTNTLASSKTYTDTSISNHNTATASHSVEMNKKAPLASPAFTGSPTAPTAPVNNNGIIIANTAFVNTAISNHNTATASHSTEMNKKANLTLDNVTNTTINTKAKESGMQPFLYMECTGNGNPNFVLTPLKAQTTLDYTKPYPIIFKPSATILATSVFSLPHSSQSTSNYIPYIGQNALSSYPRTIHPSQYIYAIVALGENRIYLQESSSIGYDASQIVNIYGNLRLKNSSNFGNKINFGDSENAYIHEDTDNHLLIKCTNGVAIRSVNQPITIGRDAAPEIIKIGNDNIALYSGTEIAKNSLVNVTDATFKSKGITAGLVPKSTKASATLSTGSWSGSSPPYTHFVGVGGVTTTSVQEIKLPASATLAQIEAAQAANIQDGGQAINQIILKAWGEKPTINIPIEIIIRGDL